MFHCQDPGRGFLFCGSFLRLFPGSFASSLFCLYPSGYDTRNPGKDFAEDLTSLPLPITTPGFSSVSWLQTYPNPPSVSWYRSALFPPSFLIFSPISPKYWRHGFLPSLSAPRSLFRLRSLTPTGPPPRDVSPLCPPQYPPGCPTNLVITIPALSSALL